MHRRRRIALAVAVAITACSGVAPLRASASERAACGAVHGLGETVEVLLSGAVPPADDRTIEELVLRAAEVRATSAGSGNPALSRPGAQVAAAASAFGGDDQDFATSPRGFVLALRSMIEECRSLGAGEDRVGPAPALAAPVLRRGDVGPGWVAAPHVQELDGLARVARSLRRCIDGRVGLPTGPMLHGADLTQAGGARQVKSSAMRVTAAEGRALLAQMGHERAPGCLQAATARSVERSSAERYALRVVGTSAEPTEDAGVVRLRTTLEVTVTGRSFPVFIDNVFVHAGRWYGVLQLVGTAEPLAEGERLVDVFRRRLGG